MNGGRFAVVYTVTDSDPAEPDPDSLNFNIDVKFSPPGNVRVNDDGLIQWDPVPGADSYRAQYRAGSSVQWTEATAADPLKGQIPSPFGRDVYQVRVRTEYADPTLNSDWSSPVDWSAPDTDGDGIPDAEEKAGYDINVTFVGGVEVTMRVTSDPTKADTDGDGKNDKAEKQALTDPARADTDGDGIPDAEELSPFQFDNRTLNTIVTNADTDSDGLSDWLEKHSLKTDPTREDSDGDGLTDMDEVAGVHGGRIDDV